MSAPEIRFAVVTDPGRRNLFFWATQADAFDGLLAGWNREEGIAAEPVEDVDAQILAGARAWLADAQAHSGKPATVMVGSVENGRWVNWNLPAVPRPAVPTLSGE